MDKDAGKTHPLRTVLLILLILIFLILVSPFLYDLIGGFRDYDDIPALIASAEPRKLVIREDGVVCFDADKSAVYAYASETELMDRLLDSLDGLPLVSGKTFAFKKFGYSIGSDVLSASVKLKLYGFLPVQLHAEAKAAYSPDTLELRLTKLAYGKWINIPFKEYADVLGLPEISEGFVIDTSDFYGELYPLAISADDDVVSFQCDILNQTIINVGDSGVVLANVVPLFLPSDPVAAKVIRDEGFAVCASVTDSAELSELLTGLLRFAPAEKALEFRDSLNDTPLLGLKLGDVSSDYATQVSVILSDYETGLTSLRNAYQEMKYHISKDGFRAEDGSPAEALLPENMGARIVLQYNQDYNSIVKANDGVFSFGLDRWTQLPNPKLSDLRRDKGVSLPKVPGISVFDLTLAVILPNGDHAIAFLTATDEFGVNVISEGLYEEILTGGAIPCYCSADIISPTRYRFATTEEAQRDLAIFLP